MKRQKQFSLNLRSYRMLRVNDVNQQMMVIARKMITSKHSALLAHFNEQINPKTIDLYEKTAATMQTIYQQRGDDIKWVPGSADKYWSQIVT